MEPARGGARTYESQRAALAASSRLQGGLLGSVEWVRGGSGGGGGESGNSTKVGLYLRWNSGAKGFRYGSASRSRASSGMSAKAAASASSEHSDRASRAG